MTPVRPLSAVAFLLFVGSFAGADDPKPFKPVKPPPPQEKHPVRDAKAVASAIDREIDWKLAEAKVAASPMTEDAEFLRRVYLDLAGRIPTWDLAAAFLDSRDPDKGAKLIDGLIDSPDFGRHLAEAWKPLLAPIDPANTKASVDRFTPWLAGELNRNRGWDKLAAEMLGYTGDAKDHLESSFLMGYSENFQPRADKLAGGIGPAFLGIQIQCAECHDHPFAPWKQADFWGIAAYFGKVRNTGIKGPPYVLTEDPDTRPLDVKNGGVERISMKPGGAIVVPSAGGNKGAGLVIPAKVPGGSPRTLDDAGPFRPAFVEWLTARDNPYFAKAFVNRTWATLFGRGLVDPVDNMHVNNPPSHPALLDLLAKELVESEFDVKHLVRSIANSRAYQQSSRPAEGNEPDAALFARMAVKPISPAALYDSVTIVLTPSKTFNPTGKPNAVKPTGGKPDAAKPATGKLTGGKPASGPGDPRDEFIKYFRGQGGANTGDLAHGIPQFLRRMNGELFNSPAPIVERLVADGVTTERAVEVLFLSALSRRPTADEQALMAKYLSGKAPADGYSGVLWVLLNSGEFVLNR
jgi:hypothetical protein